MPREIKTDYERKVLLAFNQAAKILTDFVQNPDTKLGSVPISSIGYVTLSDAKMRPALVERYVDLTISRAHMLESGFEKMISGMKSDDMPTRFEAAKQVLDVVEGLHGVMHNINKRNQSKPNPDC